MIANIRSLEMYCIDYQNIENYDTAIKSPLRYDLHHRNEISEHKSRKDLIAENLYYNRPATELIFLEHGEHMRLHNRGDKNPMFGKNLSAETRKKMSDAKKGKHPSAETRQKISDAKKGKTKSAETRRKMSEANRGEKNPMFGRHWHQSEETRKKLSDANKGKHWHLENGKHWHLENGKRVYTE